MKKKDKQTVIVGQLVNTAMHHLGETDLPYVLIIADNILSNVHEQQARMMIQDAYQLQEKLREVRVEKMVDKLEGWGGDSDTKDK